MKSERHLCPERCGEVGQMACERGSCDLRQLRQKTSREPSAVQALHMALFIC